MSAYICDKRHILYLVESAMSHQLNGCGGPFHWYQESNPSRWGELGNTDYKQAADVANMLWRENVKSVSARYPNESSGTLPGPTDGPYVIWEGDFETTCFETFDPVQVIKSCDCFDYQSCEHDDWKESEAHAFIEALRSRAWHALKGYDQAEWGAPKAMAGVISLSAMMARMAVER
jgi:hypothetical protein